MAEFAVSGQGAVPVGNWMAQVAHVVGNGVAGTEATPVGSGVGEVACRRCAIAEFYEAGQGAVPVGSGLGQVAFRCSLVRTGEA